MEKHKAFCNDNKEGERKQKSQSRTPPSKKKDVGPVKSNTKTERVGKV